MADVMADLEMRAQEDEAEQREFDEKEADREERRQAGEEVSEDEMDLDEQLLVGKVAPSAEDPKLWIVKTMKTGCEKELAMQVMGKVREYVMGGFGDQVPIYSCFATEALKGFIYMEAYSQADIINFVYGIRGVSC